MYLRFFKRVLDIGFSSLALAGLAPILGLVVLAIRLEDRGPAVFRQTRVGRNGSTFILLKFRSMPVDTRSVESAAAGSLYLTRVGRFVRRTNLDELPQLVNVLRGEMSMIGPRPALPSQDELLRLRRANGSAVLRPGLTGLAQVNSYDGMSLLEKAEWDGRYADMVGWWTDIRIVVRTAGYLFRGPPTY